MRPSLLVILLLQPDAPHLHTDIIPALDFSIKLIVNHKLTLSSIHNKGGLKDFYHLMQRIALPQNAIRALKVGVVLTVFELHAGPM